ncbi:RelA/SpoT family protein [Ichthyobacterium seriolicida]|uniref:GTP pyrophosphokinase n=1 Tax=Ichthyobacterium seriolicida TaxID=242600 RepID=A0A1J1DZN2_9FLAO|nr:RelA/SpoT family protein [Ichthyobacterium seriolicida]BAV94133.1 GTP pyrophosphokinase [Ichthyobacterium seriolicida]
MANDLQIEKRNILRSYRSLLKNPYQKLSDGDIRDIRKSFDFALEVHKDQRRKSGEPYIYHPIAVAKIVTEEIGLGKVSIISALLHDVVEDSSYTLHDIEEHFSPTVAKIVKGLTKITEVKNSNSSQQVENFRNMLLTLSDDVRVILIKLADRLHNMRTLDSMSRNKQIEKASETLFIYAPLAHRLGLYNIKSELEDLGLKYTDPHSYNSIQLRIKESESKQKEYIRKISEIVSEELNRHSIKFEIKGRPKSIYSINKKIKEKDIDIDQIYDIFAIRIIFESNIEDEKFNAWKIYSIVTDKFKPKPSRLRDWLSTPKATGYEALHTTVMGLDGKWVEIQIRSQRMDEIAERGYAAHYKYKNANTKDNFDTWILKLKDMLQDLDVDSAEFVGDFTSNLHQEEVYVFTPNGDLKSLPLGASALDFAFEIHAEIGLTCLGAKINGRLFPLSHKLKNGDQIEIVTSKNQKPKADWLNFVITGKAKSNIKASLREDNRKIVKEGREILTQKLSVLGTDFDEKTTNSLVSFFKEKKISDVFYKVGVGAIRSTNIKRFVESRKGIIRNIRSRLKRKYDSLRQKRALLLKDKEQKYKTIVFGSNEQELEYKLSVCCNPVYGDNIFGFTSINDNIVKIHREDCPNSVNMISNYGHRVIRARWVDFANDTSFLSSIKIKAVDNNGLLSGVTNILSTEMNIVIKSLNGFEKSGVFEANLSVMVHSLGQLEDLLGRLKKIEGVYSIKRV